MARIHHNGIPEQSGQKLSPMWGILERCLASFLPARLKDVQ